MLGGLEADEPEQLGLAPPPRAPGGGISYLSAVCLLRGRVYDALDNLPRAARWYRHALLIDPFNYEARARDGEGRGRGAAAPRAAPLACVALGACGSAAPPTPAPPPWGEARRRSRRWWGGTS